MPTDTKLNHVIPQILAQVDPVELEFDNLVFNITSQLYYIIKEKNISQKALAQMLNCSEASVSKQLSGDMNLTLKSIAKYLVALSAKMNIRISGKNESIKFYSSFFKDQWQKVEPRATLNIMESENESDFAA